MSDGARSSSLTGETRRIFGGLLPLVDDGEVRDILVHVRRGVGELWVDRGRGAEQVRGWQAPDTAVHTLAVSLVGAGGRHLDELNPCADVRLGDGIRVHAVLPPVAVSGATVSIRLPGIRAPSFTELVEGGLCSRAMARVVQRDVVGRKNLLITGGTASGKTTLLSALLALASPSERIVTIEDVAELRPDHPHHVSLEARQANIEGAGAVTLDQLLRETLRMRPDRIVLGECRGAELATLLAALNTGHDGSAGTLHANRLGDVPARLESLGMLGGLSPTSLARQAASALHTIVHVTARGGAHRIEQIGELSIRADGLLEVTAHVVS